MATATQAISAAAPSGDAAAAAPKKASKLPLILGLVLALVGGGGGFYAVSSGMLGGGAAAEGAAAEDEGTDPHSAPAMAPVAFVALEPLVVTLPRSSGRQFLRFVAELEVSPVHLAEVEAIRPRIADVMNGYLRAIAPEDFEDQFVLDRLRAQLLRRVQVVAGEGRVRDLLVQEFLLN